jgi:hypothetical protein
MTDTLENTTEETTEDPGLKTVYKGLMGAIGQIDEKLDSLTDGKSAGQRALTNELIEKAADSWKPLVESFKNGLATTPAETAIGIYYGIVRGLDEVYGNTAKETVKSMVDNLPTPEPLISQDEVPALQKVRSELYGKVKALISLAEQFGGADGMSMPKKRTGSKGKRGKRALSYFTFTIDDKEFDSLKDVVELYPQYTKVADLTKAIREVGEAAEPKWNLTEPPQTWEFTLPDGKTLVGTDTRTDEDDEDETDEDETEEEEDNSDEE